jgi:hypothetical protein
VAAERPVYLETWVPHHQGNLRVADEQGRTGGQPEVVMHDYMIGTSFTAIVERQRLAAAAPALVRALLGAEWATNSDAEYTPRCPDCGVMVSLGAEYEYSPTTPGVHLEGCIVEVALTAAGFPDQASRDEARKKIAEMKP